MFAKIFGWFWIIMGILFLIKPAMLRNKLQKKSFKILKKYLFAIAIILGLFLIGVGLKHQGILSKIIMVLGIIGVLKGFFFIKSKAAEKIVGWVIKQPLSFFRIAASCYILLGILILRLG